MAACFFSCEVNVKSVRDTMYVKPNIFSSKAPPSVDQLMHNLIGNENDAGILTTISDEIEKSLSGFNLKKFFYLAEIFEDFSSDKAVNNSFILSVLNTNDIDSVRVLPSEGDQEFIAAQLRQTLTKFQDSHYLEIGVAYMVDIDENKSNEIFKNIYLCRSGKGKGELHLFNISGDGYISISLANLLNESLYGVLGGEASGRVHIDKKMSLGVEELIKHFRIDSSSDDLSQLFKTALNGQSVKKTSIVTNKKASSSPSKKNAVTQEKPLKLSGAVTNNLGLNFDEKWPDKLTFSEYLSNLTANALRKEDEEFAVQVFDETVNGFIESKGFKNFEYGWIESNNDTVYKQAALEIARLQVITGDPSTLHDTYLKALRNSYILWNHLENSLLGSYSHLEMKDPIFWEQITSLMEAAHKFHDYDDLGRVIVDD